MFISDGNVEFVFNLWLSQEHTSSSKNSLRYIKRRQGGNLGSLSIMRSRCLTFAGSRILRRFGRRVICAGAHVGGDAGTSLTCEEEGTRSEEHTSDWDNTHRAGEPLRGQRVKNCVC